MQARFWKGFFYCALLAVCGFIGCLLYAYYRGTAQLEAFLQAKLDTRGGRLVVQAVEPVWDGVYLEIASYEEPGLRLVGVECFLPWSQFGFARVGYQCDLKLQELSYQLPEGGRAGLSASQYGELLIPLIEQLATTPLDAVHFSVERCVLLQSEVVLLEARLGGTVLCDAQQHWHLSAQMDSAFGDVELRGKVDTFAQALALDFVAQAHDFENWQEQWGTALAESLDQAEAQLFFSPAKADDPAFADFSGYIRWASTEPEQLPWAILGNSLPLEVYLPEADCRLGASSLGFAGDGLKRLRAYGKGSVERLRVGSWLCEGGDWALRLNDSAVAAELRLTDTVELSLGHVDCDALRAGSGQVQYFLEADALGAELFKSLGFALPEGLTLEASFQAEGIATLTTWQAQLEQLSLHLSDASLQWPEEAISFSGLTADLNWVQPAGGVVDAALSFKLEQLDVWSFPLRQIQGAGLRLLGERLSLPAVQADFLNGRLLTQAWHSGEATQPLRVELQSIDLEALVARVPQFKGELTGAVSGYYLFEWEAAGLLMTDAYLALDTGSFARLAYGVDGLLTQGLDPESAAYRQYAMAERAFRELTLSRLQMDAFPDGASGQPIRLKLYGESMQSGTLVPVDYTLNVHVDNTTRLLSLLRQIRKGELTLQ